MSAALVRKAETVPPVLSELPAEVKKRGHQAELQQ